MANKGTCELCGVSDNSYTIEDGGKVFKVCKLCHDGFVEKNGTDMPVNPLEEIKVATNIDEGGKVAALDADELAKILTPGTEERKKIYASLRKKQREDEREKGDSQKYESEYAREKENIYRDEDTEEPDTVDLPVNRNYNPVETAGAVGAVLGGDKTLEVLSGGAKKSKAAAANVQKDKFEQNLDKRAKFREQLRADANRRSTDERIVITSPEIELKKDKRYKTNLDVVTAEYENGIKFIDTFKFVIHPVIYTIFIGALILAASTGMLIINWNKPNGYIPAVVTLCAGIIACGAGFWLMWYLRSRLAVDRRVLLLRIKQEQQLFASMKAPCYRELKTKYPIFKGLAWFLDVLSIILPIVVIVCGSIAGIIISFLFNWWWLNIAIVAAMLGSILVYYIFKLCANYLYYKLDLERNQQIQQQSLLDILSRSK